MTNIIDNSTYFDRKDVSGLKWLDKNPYDSYTDRELCVLNQNLPIYRAIYIRNSQLFID